MTMSRINNNIWGVRLYLGAGISILAEETKWEMGKQTMVKSAFFRIKSSFFRHAYIDLK
jgi:hypothetical protein